MEDGTLASSPEDKQYLCLIKEHLKENVINQALNNQTLECCWYLQHFKIKLVSKHHKLLNNTEYQDGVQLNDSDFFIVTKTYECHFFHSADIKYEISL